MSTKADIRRYDALQRYGCAACRIEGLPLGPVDIHHLVDMGNRELSGGNSASIGLCVYHHRGILPQGYTVETAAAKFGPSLRHQSKAFHERYGSDRSMLARVNEEIGVAA